MNGTPSARNSGSAGSLASPISATHPAGLGSAPIGRASSPAPLSSSSGGTGASNSTAAAAGAGTTAGAAGLPSKPSAATTRYSLGGAGSSAASPGQHGLGSKGSAGALRSPSGSGASSNNNNSSNNAAAAFAAAAAAAARPASELNLLSAYLSPGLGGGGGGGGGGGAGGSAGNAPPASAGAGQAQFASYAGSLGGLGALGVGSGAGLGSGALGAIGTPGPGSAAAGIGLGGGGIGGGGGAGGAAEAALIDKWFEDLQHYEATLEEMAAASLDANFKEELGAIEQWFRVLSEAERTAALYSLLQESTQVQIRFFITVLQQMARTDPVSALLSPGAGHNSLMAEQMESKLASLGLKSPSAMKAPASAGAFRPQSELNPGAAGFLSPSAAALASAGYGAGADALAAQQQAAAAAVAQANANVQAQARAGRLKNNRTSAPGHLASVGGERSNFSGLDQVAERAVSPGLSAGAPGSPGLGSGESAQRPKSTDGLRAVSSGGSASGPLDAPLSAGLSPLAPQGPSWASMMNTPMLPGFNDEQALQQQQDALDAAAAKLEGASADQQQQQGGAQAGTTKKFGRAGNAPVPGGFNLGASSNLAGVQGMLSGMYGNGGGGNYNGGGDQLASVTQAQAQLSAALASAGVPQTSGLSPNLGAAQWVTAQQQAAVAAAAAQQAAATAELLRSPGALASAASLAQMSPNALAGLQSPSGGLANPLNMQMMNAMAAMGGLGTMSAAQLIALQNQMLQQQAGLTGQFAGLPMSAGPGVGSFGQAMRGVGAGRNAFGLSVGTAGMGARGDKPQRSPRIPGAGLPGSARAATFAASGSKGGGGAGAGAEEEEVADLPTLNDTAAWLRQLRLHKYTTNFERDHWRDMVLMDEKALEAKGVAALGARRKMLKTFEAVRAKYGIKAPGEDAPGSGVKGAEASDAKKEGEADDAKDGAPAAAAADTDADAADAENDSK